MGFILILLAALLIPGMILRTKSVFSGRKGPGLWQPLYDMRLLLNKGSVTSTTTSIIFKIAPSISLAVVLTAALLVPLGKQAALLSFEGDFVFFAYLLALGRFFMILAALDTGSSFEGMGANREALYSMLVEPAFMLLMGTFALLTGYTSFSTIISHLYFGSSLAFLAGLIALYLFVQIAMVEGSRLPVDDPKTHLELTMVHEVMVLDYSGFDLALIHVTNWLKFALYGTLIANSLVPANWHLAWQIGLFMAIQAAFAMVIGLLESFRARNKMMKNPQFILSLTALGLVAFILVLLFLNKWS